MNERPINLTSIKAILFDIGNVLIDIDYPLTISNFQKLSKVDIQSIVSYSKQIALFDLFEKGKVTADDFVAELKTYLKEETTEQQVIDAWNTMLVHYSPQKIELLKKLKPHFKLYALSNINEIHIAEMNQNIKKHFGYEEFKELFDKAYYSNEVGWRKPEIELYDMVIEEIGLRPNQILFIDDKLENLLPAREKGIQTIHLQNPEHLYGHFASYC